MTTEGKGSQSMVAASDSVQALPGDLVAHLRRHRNEIRDEWAKGIADQGLLTTMTEEEVFAEAISIFDPYVDALESGTPESLEACAASLSEQILARGIEIHEAVAVVLLLRDIVGRSLLNRGSAAVDELNRLLDVYEPAANRISITVAVRFMEERERTIREQQQAIRELSAPVLQVRDRLLVLPIIGVVDPHRARRLTEQLLGAIRASRAKVVVIDVAGVAALESNVANQLVVTIEASRLLGATVIVTGLSPEFARTIVDIGVDLAKMTTVADLKRGIEEAERQLGYRVVPAGGDPPGRGEDSAE